jgi:hypothetical protein
VVAFACNGGNGDWRLLPYAVTDALSAVTGSCGLYIAGAQQLGDDNEALLIGYQRWGGNVSFLSAHLEFGDIVLIRFTYRMTSVALLAARPRTTARRRDSGQRPDSRFFWHNLWKWSLLDRMMLISCPCAASTGSVAEVLCIYVYVKRLEHVTEESILSDSNHINIQSWQHYSSPAVLF